MVNIHHVYQVGIPLVLAYCLLSWIILDELGGSSFIIVYSEMRPSMHLSWDTPLRNKFISVDSRGDKCETSLVYEQ